MNVALSSPESKADTALSVPEQENQQASHIGLSWTARHDPTMPRQCGYALSVPKPTKSARGILAGIRGGAPARSGDDHVANCIETRLADFLLAALIWYRLKGRLHVVVPLLL